ncbi:MAG: hypothetical protein OJK14_17090 [Achromobacter sp.]|nr:hypothetical protein [Achromobacter sp.]MCW0208813.1 hypothetical protein [Achromobacter sp.]
MAVAAPHGIARAQRLRGAVRRLHHERPPRRLVRHVHQDFALPQGNEAPAGIEAHVDRGIGVQGDAAVVVQFDDAPLADAGMVIGQQPGGRRHAPQAHPADQQRERAGAQRAAARPALAHRLFQDAPSRGRRIEGRGAVEIAPEGLEPPVHPLVLRIGGAPAQTGLAVGIAGAFVAQRGHPLGGVRQHGRNRRGRHAASIAR